MNERIEIIPAIDIIDGRCVRLSQGDYSRCTEYHSSPAEMAKRFQDCGIKMIHIVDLQGAKDAFPVNLKSLEEIASATSLKIEFGGGIKNSKAAAAAFNAGASRIICGSIACTNQELFISLLNKFTPERVVLGADIKEGKIAVKGWLENGEMTVDEIIDRYIPYKIRSTIVTDITNDGMLGGTFLGLYKRLQEKYPEIDIIASGGIGNINDIIALQDIMIRYVIVGKAIYEGKITFKEIEKFNG